jgi:hypothetical protein
VVTPGELDWRRALIAVTGGIRTAGRITGLDPANISHWLNGEPYLSTESIERLDRYLGLVQGRLSPGVVHEWASSARVRFIAPALQSAFPNGATAYAREASRIISLARIRKLVTVDMSAEPFMVSDGRTFVFIRRAAGNGLRPDQIRSNIQFRFLSDPAMSTPLWIHGTPTVRDCQRLMGIPPSAPGLDDLVAFIEAHGLDFGRTIEILTHYLQSKPGDNTGTSHDDTACN